MNWYNYVYYRVYDWNLKKWGEDDVSEWKAVFGLSAVIALNLFTLLLLLNIVIDGVAPKEIPRIEAIILALVFFSVNYFLFIYKQKYKELEKLYDTENKIERRKNGYIVFAYTVGSPVFFIFISFFSIWIKK